jgi:signal transduction histidine kinase
MPAHSDMNNISWTTRVKSDVRYAAYLNSLEFYIDRYRLQQVFYNLLSNASKFRADDGKLDLTIKAWRDFQVPEDARRVWKSFYVIDICDHGIGVKNGEEEMIFLLGKRGSTASSIKGTGRGLYFVKETMLSLGGDVILIRNSAPTIFRLFFPVACVHRQWHLAENVQRSRRLITENTTILTEDLQDDAANTKRRMK